MKMGCFCGCFGHLRRNLRTKKIQHQCLSPTPSNEQHECRVKLLPQISDEFRDKHQEKKEKNPFLEKEADEFGNSDKEVQVGNEEEKENENDDESDGHQEMQCGAVIEESCSSLFSLSIDSRRQVYGAEMGEKEVSSLMKTKTETEETETEKKSSSSENDEEKDNNVALTKDPIIIMEQTIEKSKPIETSLSTWLVESKMSGGSSPESENNYADTQILGLNSSALHVKKDCNRRINLEV